MMMKIPGFVLCILLAGSYVTAETRNAGEDYAFTVISLFNEVTSCHLKTPAGVTLDFFPGEAHQHGDRYELLPINPDMPGCSVLIKNLQVSDSGVWELLFTSPTTIADPQTFEITVVPTSLPIGSYVTAETRNAGEDHAFTMISLFNEVTSCHLKTPAGDTLDFFPGEAHEHGDRYELLPINPNMPGCSVLVKNLQVSDSGVWELLFTSPTTIADPQTFEITVVPTSLPTASSVTPVTKRPGEDHTFAMSSSHNQVTSCHLKTPAGGILDFIPGEAHQHGDRYELVYRKPKNPGCSVAVKNLQDTDSGLWELSFVSVTFTAETVAFNLTIDTEPHVTAVTKNAGEQHSFFMASSRNQITSCHLKTPDGDTLDFIPGQAHQYGDRYELQSTNPKNPGCSVLVKNLQVSDSGRWELSLVSPTTTPIPMIFELKVVETEPSVTAVTKNAGEEQTFTMASSRNQVTSCHLKTPAGDTLDFIPGQAHQHGDRYQLQSMHPKNPGCSVLVKNLQSSDSGRWELSFISPSIWVHPMIFDLTVVGTDFQESGEDNVIWLSTIEFPTRTGQVIDISLPKVEYEEKCSVITPEIDTINASDLRLEFVTVHESSNYVSCRITIGPITKNLLGDWAVCGSYSENNEKHERCQPAKIFWNNENRPDAVWTPTIHENYDHPVHYGHVLTPVVIGAGDIVSCHVITPNGEDLVIKQDSEYPGIKAETLVHSICGIAIGPIDALMIGDWTIYGLFRNFVYGLNEVRLPINMFLYDEKNPYSQAYNVTFNDPVNRVVNLGNTLYVEVNINAGQVDSCSFETPSGQIFDMGNHYDYTGASLVNNENDRSVACRVAIGPITEELLGDWKLTGKFSNNGVFTEKQQTFHITQEDPENPSQENRTIIYLNSQYMETEISGIHRLIIHSDAFIHPESCHIRTPEGLQYTIMEGFSLPGIEVIEDIGVECGVIINMVSEDLAGEWALIARATRFSEAIERRLPFTIYIEENVEALQTDITITEGSDLVVRLKYPTNQYESCKLIGPYGIECAAAVRDPLHVETCGFIRKNVQTFHSGIWTITYGNKTVYKAETVVTVTGDSSETTDNIENAESTENTEPFMTNLDLLRDRSVNKFVGPANAVYCRLEDPSGFVVFDSFGRCNLTLDKVGLEHHGTWKMLIGVPGKVITEKHHLYVNVKESAGKPIVTTHVEKQRPVVIISCAVQTEAEVTACKFRDPQGNVLLAASGAAEDRYTFHGNEVSYSSLAKSHECGIRVSNPLTSDLGLWRCAIETSEDTYYGHMAVLCPWALSDPDVAATVQQEPLLTSDRSLVTVLEEEPATISCSVQAAIRYCYFRAANGTIYTVSPGMSSSRMEYVGAGFEAGECGIRFHNMYPSDSGRWNCHVGLVGDHTEQKAQLQLTVHDRMIVNHYLRHGNTMVVSGIVYERRALEYCRFVRIDGFGFTTDNVPSEYSVTGIISNGECEFSARDPSILDLHPWTVVARILGQDYEIAKDTMETILITPPEQEPEDNKPQVVYTSSGLAIFLYVSLSILLAFLLMGTCFGPKKNREWASHQASSFRRSFQRKPHQQSMTAPTPKQETMPEPPPNYRENV